MRQDPQPRSLAFSNRTDNRYWWFARSGADYVPGVFKGLSDEEWRVMEAWYAETDLRFPHGTGECAIPALSMVQGFIDGNNVRRVLQLGHFIGFSTLLLGFHLRQMGGHHRLFSIDIDEDVTAYTRRWVNEARLEPVVELAVGDSADPAMVARASDWLGGAPQVIFIDSSHQYVHTMAELDLWFDQLQPGGVIFLHDASRWAASFDGTGEGGVWRALREWAPAKGAHYFAFNQDLSGEPGEAQPIYLDGCGLGIIQRPLA